MSRVFEAQNLKTGEVFKITEAHQHVHTDKIYNVVIWDHKQKKEVKIPDDLLDDWRVYESLIYHGRKDER